MTYIDQFGLVLTIFDYFWLLLITCEWLWILVTACDFFWHPVTKCDYLWIIVTSYDCFSLHRTTLVYFLPLFTFFYYFLIKRKHFISLYEWLLFLQLFVPFNFSNFSWCKELLFKTRVCLKFHLKYFYFILHSVFGMASIKNPSIFYY